METASCSLKSIPFYTTENTDVLFEESLCAVTVISEKVELHGVIQEEINKKQSTSSQKTVPKLKILQIFET